MTDAFKILAIAGAMAIGGATVGPAFAVDNAMKVCGAKYQAAKTAGTLPAGQTWGQFLAQCRGALPKPAVAVSPAKSAPAVLAKPARPAGQPSAAQAAMYAREKQCGTQWRADKAANKVPASMKWPQYWSACNKRMK